MAESVTRRRSRGAERRRIRRFRRYAAVPRALVILALAAVTIIAPLTGFVQANKPGSMMAQVLSVHTDGESWAGSVHSLEAVDSEEGLVPVPDLKCGSAMSILTCGIGYPGCSNYV